MPPRCAAGSPRVPATNPSLDVDFHVGFDQRLRGCSLPPPHSVTLLDTGGRRVTDTIARARDWVAALTG